MEKLIFCPICESDNIQHFSRIKDFSVSGETFQVDQCDSCRLLFTNPRPLPSELWKYYKSENYVSHTNKGNNTVNFLYKLARTQTLRWKYNLVRKFTPVSLLDYGCGTGHFLSYCKTKGLEVYGFEPDNQARDIAGNKVGETIYADISLIDKSFDVVTLWHVLEHVSLLSDTMLWLKQKLNKNGRVIIAVPNYESYDAGIFKEFWAAYDVPRHLYHFSKASLTTLANKYGFCVESIHPMKLDSFYVSLLSNRYKGKGANPLHSFITGLKSNTYGKKEVNYSSLIYVLKHESA